MEPLAVLVGVMLLVTLGVDVFSTVFVPRGGAGFVTRRLYRGAWASASWAAARLGPHRRAVLALVGPVLLPATIAVWFIELVVGFGLIYLPFGDALSGPGAQQTDGWVASLYVSMYSATTLGVGDIYPATSALRLLITVEAALGFALLSIAITYALSVYGALLRATALAFEMTSFIGREAHEDAIDVVCRSIQSRSEDQLPAWLNQTLPALAATGQAQAQYPLIAYFHIPRDSRSLPLALADVLELVTICRTLPDPSAFPTLTSSPTMLWAQRTLTTFVIEHADQLRGRRQGDDVEDLNVSAYVSARHRLQSGGVVLRDEDEARRLYLALRRQWSTSVRELLRHFGHPPPNGA